MDFDAIRHNANGRFRPIFPVSELTKIAHSIDPKLRESLERVVRQHAYNAEDEYRLPMVNANVRDVLKQLVFTAPPYLRFGDAFVPCGKEVASE